MKFKTIFNAHEKHVKKSNHGEKTRPNYKPMYKESGVYELVEDGVQHCYEDIQAWLPTTDMSKIMERYIKTGDSSLLNQRAGFYGDVTNLPSNYAQLQNMLQNADVIFRQLPLEIREAFEHNPAVFYADSEKANNIINEYVSRQKVQSAKPLEVPSAPPAPPANIDIQKEGVVNE